jgi:hypothetical protein
MASENVRGQRGETNLDLRHGAVVKIKIMDVATRAVLIDLAVRSIRILVLVRPMAQLFGFLIVLADRDLLVSHLRV